MRASPDNLNVTESEVCNFKGEGEKKQKENMSQRATGEERYSCHSVMHP